MKLCLGCMHEMPDNETICPNCGYKEDTPPAEAYYLWGGTILGQRYIVGKVLGYGGFGITYIGWDELLKRIVAIKEYFPSDFATRGSGSSDITIYSGEAYEQYQAGLERFISEAKRLAQFNQSDNIVHIYDCIQENGTGYIVMEYLNGKTIKEILKEKNQFSYEEAEQIMLHVLDALEEVHKIGIVHRDVAPDNIFIMNNGQVRLLDFGAARYAASEKSKSLSVILKPGYAPEEQYRTHGEQGPWTDVYGAGATFYRMITGVRPEESIERLVQDELKKPSELGVQISARKEQVILKSISVKKAGRFQTVAEFKQALIDADKEPAKDTKTITRTLTRKQEKTGSTDDVTTGESTGSSGSGFNKKWMIAGGAAIACICIAAGAFSLGQNNAISTMQNTASNQKTETSDESDTVKLSAKKDDSSENNGDKSGKNEDSAKDAGQSVNEITETPTPEPTETPIPEPTATPTPEPTATPTPEPTATPTPEPTATPTPEATATPTPEPTTTPTPEATATPTPKATATPTPEPTATPTPKIEKPSGEGTLSPSSQDEESVFGGKDADRDSAPNDKSKKSAATSAPASDEVPKADKGADEKAVSAKEESTKDTKSESKEKETDSKKEKYTRYTVSISVGDEKRKIVITNKTQYNADVLQVLTSGSEKDESVWKQKGSKKPSVENLAIEKDKRYLLKLTDKKADKNLIFYGVDLSAVSRISLWEEGDHTYITYKTADGKEKGSTKQYRTATYAEPQTLYALTRLNVRELPDTETGAVKSKYATNDEIKVYGASTGLSKGREITWYLVKTSDGYGYISAEAGYTTNEKPVVKTNTNTNIDKTNTDTDTVSQQSTTSAASTDNSANDYYDNSSDDSSDGDYSYDNSSSGGDSSGDDDSSSGNSSSGDDNSYSGDSDTASSDGGDSDDDGYEDPGEIDWDSGGIDWE